MKKPFIYILAIFVALTSCQTQSSKKRPSLHEKIRTVILTDMTHDDGNSLIRYLYYSSWFDLEAMIVTNQLPDFNHDDTGPWDKGMSILNAYRQELEQLRKHDPDLPGYDELMAVTKQGRGALPIIWLTNTLEFSGNIADRYVTSSWDSVYFHDWIGEGLTPHGEPKDSEGSDFLVQVFEKDDERPIFVQAWGGTITFVQALHRFRQKHGEDKFNRLLPKLHLYGILFQDISFEYFASFEKMKRETCAGFGTAIPTFGKDPVELGMVVYDNGHFWHYVGSSEPGYKKPLTSKDVNGHGLMSDIYDDGGEGDMPAFLYLISSKLGLNDHLDPTQGSWGSMFTSMGSEFPENYYSTCDIDRNELVRWVPVATNSFKNRLLWSVKEPGEVNREPVAVVNGDQSNKVIRLEGSPGQTITLDASDSFDPDGDNLTFHWFRYKNADNYNGDVPLTEPNNAKQAIKIPDDIDDANVHLILELKDSGEPSLVSYRRVIIESGKKVE
ncbi:MAG: nucleoside hydrolase-like domain-containing protein [Cyclobacteriaceae bacterium]